MKDVECKTWDLMGWWTELDMECRKT